MNGWDIVSAIANFNLLGTHANILGFIWFCGIIAFTYRRLKPEYPNKGTTELKRKYWWIVPFGYSFLFAWLMQLMLDDFITTPINMAFGSWRLLEPLFGPFSWSIFFMFKVDVYLTMILIFFVFCMKDFWQYLHFTKKSALLLSTVICFQMFVGSMGWWTLRQFEGSELIKVFYLTYPEFRILSGLFVSTIIRKHVK